jgi:hypothetical protein
VEFEEFVDGGVSGRKRNRPALDRLMKAARRRDLDAVVVVRLDRLARSLAHMARDDLTEALRSAPPPFDREAFRDLVERRALDLREAFGSAPEECRRAFQTLLAASACGCSRTRPQASASRACSGYR